jgi:hypothetical protein
VSEEEAMVVVKKAIHSRSFAKDDKVILHYVIPEDAWLQYPNVARKVLYIYLEEYIHIYQSRSGKFISKNTENFILSNPNFELQPSDLYDEMDIVAILLDWGINLQNIGMLERYESREKYWEWWDKKRQEEEKEDPNKN